MRPAHRLPLQIRTQLQLHQALGAFLEKNCSGPKFRRHALRCWKMVASSVRRDRGENMLERLENRLFNSASLDGGRLTINGTAHSETITVGANGDHLIVGEGSHSWKFNAS